MYSDKDFNFRNNPQKLLQVRASIAKDKSITPSAQVYDAIGQSAKDQYSHSNNYINKAMEEAMMQSQVMLGNTKEDSHRMKYQMWLR